MGNYTLLADENCAFSKDEGQYSGFKAHVMFNVITGGDLTFSDNQIMSSPNLRMLVRKDGVIREMISNGQIKLAVRVEEEDSPKDLHDVFEDFIREGKIPRGYRSLSDSPEITFMQEKAEKIGWDYSTIRDNFTADCGRVVREQAKLSLEPSQVDLLQEELTRETAENEGLGRIFLQKHLPELMEREALMSRDQAFAFLTRCSDAVYLSNLPKTIGLNPIYADEHRPSFELLRGGNYHLNDFGDPLDLKPRLSAKHFTEGLNMLDVEDVAHIQNSPAFREYRMLSDTDDPLSDFDQLFIVYGELNRIIEDRIITRFRGLMRHSPAPDPRQLRRQYGSWVEKGTARLMDILSIASVMDPISGVAAGWSVNLLVDAVRKKISPERVHVDAARHDLERNRLETYLRSQGKSEEIAFEADLTTSESFDREIIVR